MISHPLLEIFRLVFMFMYADLGMMRLSSFIHEIKLETCEVMTVSLPQGDIFYSFLDFHQTSIKRNFRAFFLHNVISYFCPHLYVLDRWQQQ